MPTNVQSEVSFATQMQLREHVLAWISRDCGLVEFLIPDLLADTWTNEQKQAWTNCIVDKFLRVSRGEGRRARRNILACELAGALRRSCLNLRQRTVTYREIMKTSVSLESLWNDVSPELEDATWAKCSRLFDVALTSLRVTYVWVYIKTESREQQMSLDTKRSVFQTLVDNFFQAEAPTDETEDKHSTNFRDLLKVWKSDFKVIAAKSDFDEALKKLEETNGLDATATCIEKFLEAVDVDDSWILRMLGLEKELVRGNLVPKGTAVEKSVKKVVDLKKNKPPSDTVFKPDPDPYESASSHEPKQADSDYQVGASNSEGEDDMTVSSAGEREDQEDPYVHAQFVTTSRPKQVQMMRDVRMRGSSMPHYGETMREVRLGRHELDPRVMDDDEDEDEEQNYRTRSRGAAAVKAEPSSTPPQRRKRPQQPTRASPRLLQQSAGQASSSGAIPITSRRRSTRDNMDPRRSERRIESRRVRARLAETSHEDGSAYHTAGSSPWPDPPETYTEVLEERRSKRKRIQAALAADMSQSTTPTKYATEHRRQRVNGK